MQRSRDWIHTARHRSRIQFVPGYESSAKSGWPKKVQLVPQELTTYWKVKDVCNKLLLYNSWIVVPKSIQKETLQRIHTSHLGIEKCKKCTSFFVWWPGVMQQITQFVQSCQVCAKQSKPRNEPLVSTIPGFHTGGWERGDTPPPKG